MFVIESQWFKLNLTMFMESLSFVMESVKLFMESSWFLWIGKSLMEPLGLQWNRQDLYRIDMIFMESEGFKCNRIIFAWHQHDCLWNPQVFVGNPKDFNGTHMISITYKRHQWNPTQLYRINMILMNRHVLHGITRIFTESMNIL